jgi:hypothetical protein
MAGVTGRQGMLTSPWNLIPPLVFPWVRVSLIFLWIVPFTWSGHWFWLQNFPFSLLDAQILTADDSSVSLIWTHWFWLLILCLKWGSRQAWPVDRGCLLLLCTWSHFWYIQRSVFAPFSDLYFLQEIDDCYLCKGYKPKTVHSVRERTDQGP